MEAVGQRTGGIAHDFNNMLAVIIGGLNLIQRKLIKGETDIKRFVDGAIDGAQRAAELTKRLLAFSRQQPLSPRRLNINRRELLGRTLGETIQVETVLGAALSCQGRSGSARKHPPQSFGKCSRCDAGGRQAHH